ncbi:hypothetical protein [Donghicola sp. XS_ASV15]|uniref:hypothetical protein n=1 Tax=Donghicola sp. XS_ASV15 TaxID=3241295 RepID=UPI0035145A2C
MTEWYANLPGKPRPDPISGKHLAAWPDDGPLNFGQSLGFCPLTYSELHMIAYHLPIAAIAGSEGPEIMLDLRRDRLVSPPTNVAGEWKMHYLPMALRLLPFNATASGKEERLLDLHIGENKARSPENQASLKRLLVRFAQGRKRLTTSARILVEEGFLTNDINPAIYEIDQNALLQKTLQRPHAQAFRLLMVMLFSQRNYVTTQRFSAFMLHDSPSEIKEKKDGLDISKFLSSGSSIQF